MEPENPGGREWNAPGSPAKPVEQLPENAPRSVGATEFPIGHSVFDAPTLAGNVAHELTNALFALHLHLDPFTPASGPGKRNGQRGRNGAANDASRRVLEAILGRLDDLTRGLRLVSRVSARDRPEPGPRPTTLGDWWAIARVLLHVSVPKGIDLHADWPKELPAVDAEPAEITACALAIIRKALGHDGSLGKVGPCTVRLFAVTEGRWLRIVAVAHALSEEFTPDPASLPAGQRFRHEPEPPRAASMLVSCNVSSPLRRVAAEAGKVP
jgi:hypothetical protein